MAQDLFTWEEIVEKVRARFPSGRSSAAIDDPGLRRFCERHHLLGRVGRHPCCYIRVEQGSKGRSTKFFTAAVDRVEYVVRVRSGELGGEKIRGALEWNLRWYTATESGDETNFRFLLTIPLVLLLNCKKPDYERLQAVYAQVWGWSGKTSQVLKRLRRKLARARSTSAKKKERHRGALADPNILFFTHPESRHYLSLGSLLEPPSDAQSYLAEFREVDKEVIEKLIAAMRRVACRLPQKGDLARIARFAFKGYSIKIKGKACSPKTDKKDADHYIYKCAVKPDRVQMTLLQQTTAHLLRIFKKETITEWIKPCINFGRCGRFFTSRILTAQYCGRSYCRKYSDTKQDIAKARMQTGFAQPARS